MIRKIPFYKMNLNEIARAGVRVLKAALKITNEAFKATKMTDNLEGSNNEMKLAQARLTSEQQTELMANYDNRRDRSFKSWKHAIISAEYRNDEEKQKSGNLLHNLLDKHGWNLDKFPYPEQTDRLDAIFVDCDNNEQHTAAISTIGTQGIYADLKEENTLFKEAETKRSELRAMVDDLVPTDISKKVVQHSELLVQYVEVMQQVSPQEEFNTFLKEIEIIADDMYKKINMRQAKSEEDATESISE